MITTDIFGDISGQPVRRFSIGTDSIKVRLIELGAAVQGISVKNADGDWTEVVLCHADLDSYISDAWYWGATCGRHVSWIENVVFSINGQIFFTDKNEGEYSLHSGRAGFQARGLCSHRARK